MARREASIGSFMHRPIALERMVLCAGLMSERMITTNGVDLCTASFGDTSDPAVLLVAGASCSMLRWEEEFCGRLVDGGRQVVRYDNRDVGRSTTYEPGTVPYTIEDLADDAVGVLDAYGVERAHLVGASMGGMICQQVALRNPDRVLTLTPIISTPDPSSIFDGQDALVADGVAPHDRLPGPKAEVLAAMVGLASLDWSDEAAVIEAQVRTFAAVASPLCHDEARARALVGREIARAGNYQSGQNHATAVGNTPSWRYRLADVRVPTLVIYGTEDPILPPAHSEVLAREIPGAALLAMDGVGHDIPPAAWDGVVAAILAHTRRDEDMS
jgi:pimeloyl-ACP methyl ester carboxylesterase